MAASSRSEKALDWMTLRFICERTSPLMSFLSASMVDKTENIKQFILPSLVSGQATDDNKMLWFRNTPAGEPFLFSTEQLKLLRQGSPNSLRADWTPALMTNFVSTDYSLQLRMAIEDERFFNGIQQALNVMELTSTTRPPESGSSENLSANPRLLFALASSTRARAEEGRIEATSALPPKADIR